MKLFLCGDAASVLVDLTGAVPHLAHLRAQSIRGWQQGLNQSVDMKFYIFGYRSREDGRAQFRDENVTSVHQGRV
jgi:hypothetical protein